MCRRNKLGQNIKIQIMTNVKNSKCDKTQKLKLWGSLKYLNLWRKKLCSVLQFLRCFVFAHNCFNPLPLPSHPSPNLYGFWPLQNNFLSCPGLPRRWLPTKIAACWLYRLLIKKLTPQKVSQFCGSLNFCMVKRVTSAKLWPKYMNTLIFFTCMM